MVSKMGAERVTARRVCVCVAAEENATTDGRVCVWVWVDWSSEKETERQWGGVGRPQHARSKTKGDTAAKAARRLRASQEEDRCHTDAPPLSLLQLHHSSFHVGSRTSGAAASTDVCLTPRLISQGV